MLQSQTTVVTTHGIQELQAIHIHKQENIKQRNQPSYPFQNDYPTQLGNYHAFVVIC